MRRWASDPLRAPPLHERLQLRPTALCGRRAPADTAGGLGRRRLLVTIESAAACGATVMPQRAGYGCRAALTGDGVSLGDLDSAGSYTWYTGS